MMTKKKSLSVTDLCAYKFCPRSLYIKLVLGLREKVKPVMVLGSIRHKVFEEANNLEKELVERISSRTQPENTRAMFAKSYKNVLDKSVSSYSKQLDSLKLDKKEIMQNLKPAVKLQSEERADEISDFASKNKIFGKQLWEKLRPRIISELKIFSKKLKLKGIVDRIEIYGNEYVPVEIKTGRVPRTGVWPDHRLQVAAYMMLINEKFNSEVKEGLVRYVKENQTRQIVYNPFMEHEVLGVRNEVFDLMENDLPGFCGKSYCTVCSYGDKFENHLTKK